MLGNLFGPLPMKIAGGAIVALVLALVVALAFVNSLSARAKAERKAREAAEAEVILLRTDAALKEIAAIERETDRRVVDTAQKELLDAIAGVPDAQPDAVRVALGCERLRRAGTPPADLPAICRPGR